MSHDVPIDEQLNDLEISEQETLLRGKKRKAEEAQLEDRHVDHDDNSRGQLNEKDDRFSCSSDSQNVQVPSQHKKRKLGDSDAIYTGYSIPDHISSVTNIDPIAAIISNTNIRGESNQNLPFSPAEISVFTEIVATSLAAARTHLHTSSHHSNPTYQYIPRTRQELLNLIQDVEEDASDFFYPIEHPRAIRTDCSIITKRILFYELCAQHCRIAQFQSIVHAQQAFDGHGPFI